MGSCSSLDTISFSRHTDGVGLQVRARLPDGATTRLSSTLHHWQLDEGLVPVQGQGEAALPVAAALSDLPTAVPTHPALSAVRLPLPTAEVTGGVLVERVELVVEGVEPTEHADGPGPTHTYRFWALDEATGETVEISQAQADAIWEAFVPQGRTVPAPTHPSDGQAMVQLLDSAGQPVPRALEPVDEYVDPVAAAALGPRAPALDTAALTDTGRL